MLIYWYCYIERQHDSFGRVSIYPFIRMVIYARLGDDEHMYSSHFSRVTAIANKIVGVLLELFN
jgi:hypothetical protein